MTTPNPMPPQVIEKWRKEFEDLMKSKYPGIDLGFYTFCQYLTPLIDGYWQGFLLARSTVEIELPEPKSKIDCGDWTAYFSPNKIKKAIKSQGYRVAGEK